MNITFGVSQSGPDVNPHLFGNGEFHKNFVFNLLGIHVVYFIFTVDVCLLLTQFEEIVCFLRQVELEKTYLKKKLGSAN